ALVRQGQSLVNQPMQAGRIKEKAYYNEDINALSRSEGFRRFLGAQAHPAPPEEIRFFRVDAWKEDRNPAPADGFKEASLVLMWSLGPGMFQEHRLHLPFALPEDRRDKTKVAVE